MPHIQKTESKHDIHFVRHAYLAGKLAIKRSFVESGSLLNQLIIYIMKSLQAENLGRFLKKIKTRTFSFLEV